MSKTDFEYGFGMFFYNFAKVIDIRILF